MTVWYAGLDVHPNLHTHPNLVYVTLCRRPSGMQVWMFIQICIPDSHLHRVTYTRCRIDTINSPDDGHIAARNMWRIEINIHEKELCVKLVIYKDFIHDFTPVCSIQ